MTTIIFSERPRGRMTSHVERTAVANGDDDHRELRARGAPRHTVWTATVTTFVVTTTVAAAAAATTTT